MTTADLDSVGLINNPAHKLHGRLARLLAYSPEDGTFSAELANRGMLQLGDGGADNPFIAVQRYRLQVGGVDNDLHKLKHDYDAINTRTEPSAFEDEMQALYGARFLRAWTSPEPAAPR